MLFVKILMFVTLLVTSVSTVVAFGYIVIRFVELRVLPNIPFIDEAINDIINKLNKHKASDNATVSESNDNPKNDREFDELMAQLRELGI